MEVKLDLKSIRGYVLFILLWAAIACIPSLFMGCENLSNPSPKASETTDANEYTVTFNSIGGSAVLPQTVAKGGKATLPAQPTKSNATFFGWYTESACKEEWDFDTDTVNANRTLYAKWTLELGGTWVGNTDDFVNTSFTFTDTSFQVPAHEVTATIVEYDNLLDHCIIQYTAHPAGAAWVGKYQKIIWDGTPISSFIMYDLNDTVETALTETVVLYNVVVSTSPTAPPSVPPTIPPSTPPLGTEESSAYFGNTAGTSITYTIIYPDGYSGTEYSELHLTSQGALSNSSETHIFITSSDMRHDSSRFTIANGVLTYNGGWTSSLGSTLLQKICLPANLPTIDSPTFEVTSSWYGSGTYTVERLPSYIAGGETWSNCLKIGFPTGKLNFTGQLGHGFYVLAMDIGVVHYEATMDTDGNLGDIGETITFIADEVVQLSSRQCTATIVDEDGNAIPNAYLDFNGGYGPAIQANSIGFVMIDTYLPEGDQLGSVSVYSEMDNGTGVYPRSYESATPTSGGIALGNLSWAMPEFSPVTYVLEPANGSTNVDKNLTKLRITFSAPMQNGYSFINFGVGYPQSSGSTWLDSTTIELTVQLEANTTYRLGLNSQFYTNFRDAEGRILEPVDWTFTTGN